MDIYLSRMRLDRRISYSLLLSILLQFIALIARADYLEARVSTLETARAGTLGVPERLARLEERVEAVRQDVAYIRHALERGGR